MTRGGEDLSRTESSLGIDPSALGPIFDIRQNILHFHERATEDAHHRYRSWDHCYLFFRNRDSIINDEQIDLAALHLGFYLASWGMYRGRSFLLWKDYKIHTYAVRELLSEKYSPLWDLDVFAIEDEGPDVNLVLALVAALKDAYKTNIAEVNGEPKPVNPSDALATKIVLGTLGCTPASDRYFRAGLKHCQIPYSRFNRRHYLRMLDFCRGHSDELRTVQAQVGSDSVKYPFMKLVDMYFWSIGRQLEDMTSQGDTGE